MAGREALARLWRAVEAGRPAAMIAVVVDDKAGTTEIHAWRAESIDIVFVTHDDPEIDALLADTPGPHELIRVANALVQEGRIPIKLSDDDQALVDTLAQVVDADDLEAFFHVLDRKGHLSLDPLMRRASTHGDRPIDRLLAKEKSHIREHCLDVDILLSEAERQRFVDKADPPPSTPYGRVEASLTSVSAFEAYRNEFDALTADEKTRCLHAAIGRRDLALVERLLALGADPNRSPEGISTLSWAALFGDDQMRELLEAALEAGDTGRAPD